MIRLHTTDYTVGWICAIRPEYVAAQEFLDEEHKAPHVSPNDTNHYTLGKVGEHNVVIAVLPDGEYGTDSAAIVATNLRNTFANVRIALMVGIGGGAPSEHNDIRLGDVIVSAPRDGMGGVFQYDYGKSIQNQKFTYTRFLNQPPTVLRTAVTAIQAQHERKGNHLAETVNRIIGKNTELHGKYERPQSSTDRLFNSEIVHDARGCEYCAENPLNLKSRNERNKNPVVHYGLIASANQLMKDALARDQLIAEKNVLCFEMEAAGLMNNFPCLVIRGICDYSDSHKNKDWQGYAAMVAAAYAKDLLGQIAPTQVEAEKPISEILSNNLDELKLQTNILQEQVTVQKNQVEQALSEKQTECLHLFRLTSSDKDTTYEWYKDRVEDRIEGTCEWFLRHENFQQWLKQEFGLLLVSADPGCGKSVLAKYLIDHKLRRTPRHIPSPRTICYFFFKSQDQNTVHQALCALIHQLLSQLPHLIHYAMENYKKEGPGLINSTATLWVILDSIVRDPLAGPILIVLDALDECIQSEMEDLIQRIRNQFHRGHSSYNKLKYLFTSRPYEQIIGIFRSLLKSLPNVHIPGGEELETISHEINHVIKYRVEQLARRKSISAPAKSRLEEKLLSIPHRTYLWAYLVFDYLMGKQFRMTPKGIDDTMAALPTSIFSAYEQILSKSPQEEKSMVRRALSMILAANRPLTVSEMNIALSINRNSKSIADLDLEEDRYFISRLRNCCGLFVSIFHDQVYFIHQTAREFLIQAPSLATIPQEPRWQHSITDQVANKVLGEACVLYLDLLNNEPCLKVGTEKDQLLGSYKFLDYSAKGWGAHYRDGNNNNDLADFVLKICDPSSRSWRVWFKLYWSSKQFGPTPNFNSLITSSYFGHEGIVKLLLQGGAKIDSKDGYDRTPLLWAAQNGHEEIVKLLLQGGTEINSRALSWAAQNGHKGIVKLLLQGGAEIDSIALLWVARNGHEGIMKLLLQGGAKIDSKDGFNQTPLSLAAENGHEGIVKLLLQGGAEIDFKNGFNQTPLLSAAQNGHEGVVKLLLQGGAEINSKDGINRTPLSSAAQNGHEGIVKLLLQGGAEIDSRALSWAAQNGHEGIVKLLLQGGAEIDSKNGFNRTPLSSAAQNGHEGIVKLLLQGGAEINSKDGINRTPLSSAAQNGHEGIVKLLLQGSAKIDSRALLSAAQNGHEGIVKLLLQGGAKIDSRALSWAAEKGHEGIVKLLLQGGAKVDSKNKYDQTLLSQAAEKGHEGIVKLLLQGGAEVDSRALSWAAKKGHEGIVKLLLQGGAEVDSKDEYDRTPLSWAAQNGHAGIVKLLLQGGAEVDSKDEYDRTPLSWAAQNGHAGIVKLLLQGGAEIDSRALSWAAENRYKGPKMTPTRY